MLDLLAQGTSGLKMTWFYFQIFMGFSFIIFFHELGHFAVAKWAGVRVEQFAIGFFREVIGFTYGETRYSFNLLPLGGYVKMLGQEDFEVDAAGDLQYRDDPRSFANKPVGHRAAIVSAGVIMNLVLAALLFMVVFLIGKQADEPRVGAVVPDGPAALAGLQSGDIIREIDGTQIDEFFDIQMAVQLTKPGKPLGIKVDRDGETFLFQIDPERSADRNSLQLGITSPQSATLVGVGVNYDPAIESNPHIGDRIVEIAGQSVTEENENKMMHLLMTDPLACRRVVVERPTDLTKKDGPTQRVNVTLRPRMVLMRTSISKTQEQLSVLGLVPLQRVSEVREGGRADLAGIKVGDVIVQWNGIELPTAKQIAENIKASAPKDDPDPEKDIPLRVQRPSTGKTLNLVVRPKVKIVPITGKRHAPTIQAKFDMFADDYLRVAAVVPEIVEHPTPAAVAGIPAGALITKVNDTPVKRWVDLAELLRANAGGDVTLTYDHKAEHDLTCVMYVPATLHTVLQLGPEAVIVAVDGKEKVLVDEDGYGVDDEDRAATGAAHRDSNGKDKKRKRRMHFPVRHPVGLRAALKDRVGETVEIKFRRNVLAAAETATVTVTEDMLDPWTSAVRYTSDVVTGGKKFILRKGPLGAIELGMKKTYYFIVQVYQVMERMIFSRSMGVEQIAGPVGIVKMGGAMAERGFTDLLFFLAMISANLAVINFLPLPIVDGGLMVFLLIEKIKGSPISMRVQVATQVVGLVLIVTAFLFVTLMDITR